MHAANKPAVRVSNRDSRTKLIGPTVLLSSRLPRPVWQYRLRGPRRGGAVWPDYHTRRL